MALSGRAGRPLEGQRFVWLLSPPWHGLWTRQNHFVERLTRLGAEVLYVETPGSWRKQLRRRSWTPEVESVGERLHVMRLPLNVPGTKRARWVGSLNGRATARWIRSWLDEHGWQDYVVWCRVPHSVHALDRLDARAVVYDITDDYALYAQSPGEQRLVTAREQALLSQADAVFITSEELLKKPAVAEAAPVHISNGVAYDLFASAGEPGPVDPALEVVTQPIIGYVGLTARWMDFELLERLAQRWPGQIAMVGPVSADVQARADAIGGVHWLGFQPHHTLPQFLRAFRVCIMPHQTSALRKRANPLKVYEYLATGKPFVSVDLPALDPVRDLVDVATDADSFEDLVAQRLEDPRPELKEARQNAARAFRWDHLFDRVLGTLGERGVLPSELLPLS